MKTTTLTRANLLRSGALILCLIAVLAFVGLRGLSTATADLDSSTATSKAALSAADADMYHDNIRGDVNNAFRISTLGKTAEAKQQGDTLRTDTAAHVQKLLSDLNAVRQLHLSTQESAVFDEAVALATKYGAAATATIDTILTDEAAGVAAYPAFQATFDELASTLDTKVGSMMDSRLAAAQSHGATNSSSSKRLLLGTSAAVLLLFAFVGRRLYKVITSFTAVQAENARITSMVESSPTGMVFADNDEIVRYVNPAFKEIIVELGSAIAVRPDDMVGSPLSAFHADHGHNQRIMATELPHHAVLPIGDQFVDLLVDAIEDEQGQRIGTMTSWTLVTDKVRAEGTQKATADKMATILLEVNKTATQLASAAEEFTSVSRTMASTAESAASQAGTVSNASNSLSENTSTVALGVGELRESISEISRSAADASAVANEALTVAQHTGEIVTRLGASSAEIGNVVGVISSIAEQTNLLALNATIEAARAGELGKGFAVVANEVKELANSTAKATGDIQAKVQAIQAQTQEAVDAINGIAQVISQITDGQVRIAAAVEEQSATSIEIGRSVDDAARGSAEIAEAIRSVASGASDVASGANDTERAAEELARLAASLQDLVADVHGTASTRVHHKLVSSSQQWTDIAGAGAHLEPVGAGMGGGSPW